jgi:hypothetical protein
LLDLGSTRSLQRLELFQAADLRAGNSWHGMKYDEHGSGMIRMMTFWTAITIY